MAKSASFVALLRAINVAGHNQVPMAALRAVCADAGWTEVETYIQSGNVVFNGRGAASHLEATLERAIQQRFELTVPVIVRTAAEWAGYVEGNPIRESADAEPNRVLMLLSKARPRPGATEALLERAKNGERIMQQGDALWIHYPDGTGRSKLTPVLLDRIIGSPVTGRNWRTVVKLQELLTARER